LSEHACFHVNKGVNGGPCDWYLDRQQLKICATPMVFHYGPVVHRQN